jgi:hypothetical protein
MIRITSAAIAVGALLALPSAGQAAENFGSRLSQNPANSNECQVLMGPCTIASYIHPSDPNGDPYAGGAPRDGVITKFRIRGYGEGGPASVTFRLARISLQSEDVALGASAGTGPTVTLPEGNGGDVPISEFPGRLPVEKGEYLAIDGTNVAATYNSSGDRYSYTFAPPLVDGQGQRGSNTATGELLVAAVIEADADRDGFGDETQDQCLGSPSSAPPCAPATDGPGGGKATDRVKPKVRGVRLTRRALVYRLSESAKVTVRIKKGRRTVKTIKAKGRAGKNRIAINRRKLASGRYTLVVTAQDAAANKSAAKRIGMRVSR